MTTTTSRTATRAPATQARSRLALVVSPGRAAGTGSEAGSPLDADGGAVPPRDLRPDGGSLAETGAPAARGLHVDRAVERGVERGVGRHEWVRRVLGVTVTVHGRGSAAHGPEADGAVRSMFAELFAVARLVSTDRPGAQLGRLARGELTLADAHPVLRELHALCVAAHVRTDGAVDAWAGPAGPEAPFEPGGLVTTWALDRAARHLDGLADVAFAVEADGDLLLRGPQDEEPWHVEIEHPRDRRLVLASLPVHAGGVATATATGSADVVDLRSGLPEPTVLAATVVGPSLVWSDVWARAAVARGSDAAAWVATLRGTRGLLALADGSVHRWHTPA